MLNPFVHKNIFVVSSNWLLSTCYICATHNILLNSHFKLSLANEMFLNLSSKCTQYMFESERQRHDQEIFIKKRDFILLLFHKKNSCSNIDIVGLRVIHF